MSRFKELLKKDMATIMDLKELTEEVIIDGKKLNVLIGSLDIKGTERKGRDSYESHLDEKNIFVRLTKVGYEQIGEPKQGDHIELNGSSYKVSEIGNQISSIKIILKRYSSEATY